MKKKLLAILLALALCLALPFSAGAASFDRTAAGKLASGLLDRLKADVSGVKVTVDEGADLNALLESGFPTLSLPETAVSSAERAPALQRKTEAAEEGPLTATGTYTVDELSRLIRKYLFIRIDDPADAAALIAETTEFSYALVNGSDGTLYMRVDIENNPQIFNYDVFRALVEQLYEKQGEEMQKDEYGKIDYVMSYEHIAGELALHAVAFAALNEILRVTGSRDERLLQLYASASQADLNVDEARVPSGFIKLVGALIINVFKYNVLKFFSFLA